MSLGKDKEKCSVRFGHVWCAGKYKIAEVNLVISRELSVLLLQNNKPINLSQSGVLSVVGNLSTNSIQVHV